MDLITIVGYLFLIYAERKIRFLITWRNFLPRERLYLTPVITEWCSGSTTVLGEKITLLLYLLWRLVFFGYVQIQINKHVENICFEY